MSKVSTRINREIINLQKNSDAFLISFDESNLRKIDAIIKAPKDSLYKHTFIRLQLNLPDNYPFSPPKVKFINYKGTRIHPNLYGCGKVCLSILGTWTGPSWISTMTIESVLLSIQSLLDNTPYIHEPNQKNDKLYNQYVRFETFDTLLFSYIKNEKNELIKNYIQKYITENYNEIKYDLEKLNKGKFTINTRYNMNCVINYDLHLKSLEVFSNLNNKKLIL